MTVLPESPDLAPPPDRSGPAAPSGWSLSALPVRTGPAGPRTASFDDLSRRFVLDLLADQAAACRGIDRRDALLLLLSDSARAAAALLSPYVLDGAAVRTDPRTAGVTIGPDGAPDAAWFGELAIAGSEAVSVGVRVAALVVPVADRVAEATGRAPAETADLVAGVLAADVARLARESERLGLPDPDLGAVLRGALETLGQSPHDPGRAFLAS